MLTPYVSRLRVAGNPAEWPIPVPAPRLSWVTEGGVADWIQAHATVRIERPSGDETITLDGRESVDVEWPFRPLQPREQVRLSLQVTGADGSTSPWSTPVATGSAFLGAGEWRAAFIGAAVDGPAILRRTLPLDELPRRAMLYTTALGVVAGRVNGLATDDGVLAPGWTSYRHRLVHETADVTAALRTGQNVIELVISGGWFTESYGFGDDQSPYYGTRPSGAAQLHLEFADGRTQVIATGSEWEVAVDGPLRSSGIYAGEAYDARRAPRDWQPVTLSGSEQVPEARTSPAVRRIEEVAVRGIITTPSGATVLDFGQNLVGRVRLTSRGRPGDRIVLQHAEVLEHGELALRPLRHASARDEYVHGGDGVESWEPEFTFHGFRYVQVDGVADLRLDDFTAVVLHSDMRRTGDLVVSHPLLQRFHDNVVWSMRGNALSLPTDCPQRDERLGWTGDVQVFAPTAAYLYDCEAFLGSWLRDLHLEQQAADGIVPIIVPWVIGWEFTEVAAWGDAATVLPTVLHERLGAQSVVRAQFASMVRWADRLLDRAGPAMLIEGGFQFGDWLDPTAPPEHPEQAATHPDLVASAWFVRSLDLVARAAATVDSPRAEQHYRRAAAAARAAFQARHLLGDRLSSDAPTAYALAICFDLVPAADRAPLGERLAALVAEAGNHIATGFVGTPLILDALTSTGHLDTAMALLLQEECPSWLYPVTMGATTVWERWDSMRPDGSVNPGEMTSFNHYALGAVADWMHRELGGLAPLEPGYRTLRIAPRTVAQLDHARATLDTPYGPAASGWSRDGAGTVTVTALVPMNTRALVQLPDGSEHEVGAGEHSWRLP